jgi:hypothetical protein
MSIAGDPAAHDQLAKGYPTPTFNLAGYMIYDRPVRIFNDRFVNFKVDPTPLLDATDVSWLNQFSSKNKYAGNKAFTYEGACSQNLVLAAEISSLSSLSLLEIPFGRARASGRSRTAGSDPAAGDEDRAADDGGQGSPIPRPPDHGIDGQEPRR